MRSSASYDEDGVVVVVDGLPVVEAPSTAVSAMMFVPMVVVCERAYN